jgi:3-hydroxyacyl-CoA dehydrogenase/enoyl-CoA hydratase/3-hydroxybutyryl-CoA epimerase
MTRQDITDRLILRMVNEAKACLREKIVSDEDLLDAGMIFGTGFAPFLGGPIHYAKTRGRLQIQERLAELANRYGERFQPDKGWHDKD